MNKEQITQVLEALVPQIENYPYAMIGTANLLIQGIDGLDPADVDFVTDDATVRELKGKFDGTIKTDGELGYIKTTFEIDGYEVEFVSYEKNTFREKASIDNATLVDIGNVKVFGARLESEMKVYGRMARDKDLKKVMLIKAKLDK